MNLNSNKERREYWDYLARTYSQKKLNEAFGLLDEQTREVIELHYKANHPLTDITRLINRSITTVRNLQLRGIYKLYCHFSATNEHK